MDIGIPEIPKRYGRDFLALDQLNPHEFKFKPKLLKFGFQDLFFFVKIAKTDQNFSIAMGNVFTIQQIQFWLKYGASVRF